MQNVGATLAVALFFGWSSFSGDRKGRPYICNNMPNGRTVSCAFFPSGYECPDGLEITHPVEFIIKKGLSGSSGKSLFPLPGSSGAGKYSRTYNKILTCRQSEMLVFPQVATCGYENPTFQVKPLHPVYCASLCGVRDTKTVVRDTKNS
jgi:hypothetical protein